MDGGSFRTPQPDRRVVSRSEPTARPQEVPQPIAEEPKPVHRAPSRQAPTKEKKSSKRPLAAVIIIAIVLILGVVGWYALSGKKNAGAAIDTSKYQAVSLTDGQLYFGKLTVVNDDYLKLTNVYYLKPQSGEDTTEAAKNTNSFNLIKFTDVIYGPEDEIVIAKSQVLFYENLNPEGKVAKGIDQLNNK